MLIIQVILILFFLIAIINVVKKYRDRSVTIASAAAWIGFWLVAGVVAMIPNATFYLANLVGITRGSDLVVYSALVLMFFLFFRLTVKVESMNKNITRLARDSALQDINEKNKE